MSTRPDFPINFGALEDEHSRWRAFCELKMNFRDEPVVMVSIRTFVSDSDCKTFLQTQVAPTFPSVMDELIEKAKVQFVNEGFAKDDVLKVANMLSGVFGFAMDPDDKDFGQGEHRQDYQEVLNLPDGSVIVIDSAWNGVLSKYAPLIHVIHSRMEILSVCESKIRDTHEELIPFLNQVHSEFRSIIETHTKPNGEFVKSLKVLLDKHGFVAVKQMNRMEKPYEPPTVH